MTSIKIIVLTILLLMLSIITSTASVKSLKIFTFEHQTNIISKEMFPEIKKYIENFEYKYTNEVSQQLAEDVFDIIQKYSKIKKIHLLLPPKIEVYKAQDINYIFYALTVQIILYDSDESNHQVSSSILIGKQFLINIRNKNQVEI